MPQKNKKPPYRYRREDNGEIVPALSDETKKGIFIVFLLLTAFLTVFSLFDLAGTMGLYIKQGMSALLGWGVYFFPIVPIVLSYFLLRPEKYEVKPSNYLGLIIFIFSYLGLLQIIAQVGKTEATSALGGGYLGMLLTYPLEKIMGTVAATLVVFSLLIISLLITFNTGLNALIDKINLFKRAKDNLAEAEAELAEENESEEAPNMPEENNDGWTKTPLKEAPAEKEAPTTSAETETNENKPSIFSRKKTSNAEKSSAPKIPADLKITYATGSDKIIQLPLSLLNGKTSKPTSGDIKSNMEKIKATLENFGIEVAMGEVSVGPTITQFTLKPTEGVRISNITALQNDLALALAAHPIRIEAPIPGKSLIGIEVPNQSIATVRLREIIDDEKFKNKKGGLLAALGKDVSGKNWSIDLTSMPHLLIAGATGSGKSVCINSIIISLLYQYVPNQLRLIMVDPKRVELTAYNAIPHLLTPVITETNKTVNALRWAVREMDERYKLLEAVGKRNITAYNASVITNRLPFIVIIIDELADLMSAAPKEIEAAIVRIAQMARAVGIHLVVATQRPSVNIITGQIKANITSRIAFSVASGIDSRTILDFGGAEKLLGKGDMLYVSAELSKPKRLQGALITDEEIERVVDFWRGIAEPVFNDEVTEKQGKLGFADSISGGDDEDELLEEAKDVIIRAGKASASLLQRRLRVGYARAARLLDLMEQQGIIGPADGAKPREILITTSAGFTPRNDDEDYVTDDEEEEQTAETENQTTDEEEKGEEEENFQSTEDDALDKYDDALENDVPDDYKNEKKSV